MPLTLSPEFISLTVVALVAIITPGPDFALITRNSVLYPRNRALLTVLGVSSGVLFHLVYTLMGICVLVYKFPWLYEVIRLLGVGYLCFMGIRSLIRAAKPPLTLESGTSTCPISRRRAYGAGLLSNLLNPNAILLSISIFTTIVSVDTPVHLKILYGLWIALLRLLWFMLVAFFCSQEHFKIKLLGHHNRIQQLTGIVLILMGIHLATTEL